MIVKIKLHVCTHQRYPFKHQSSSRSSVARIYFFSVKLRKHKNFRLIILLTNRSIVKQTQIKCSLITASIICPRSTIPLDYNSLIWGRNAATSADYDNCSNMSFPAILVAPLPIWTTHNATAGFHFSFSAKFCFLRSHTLHAYLRSFNWAVFRRITN